MSQSGSQPSGDQPQPVELTPVQPAPAPGEQPLLDHVLQRTISALATDSWISPELMQSLSAVAWEHRAQAFSVEPAGLELIDAILLATLSPGALAVEKRRQMAREIAETLFDDPQIHGRLQALWKQLIEAPQ